jgi:hypothetical protein
MSRPATARTELTTDGIRARRHARELVADMHWQGIAVPPLYTRMAAEFQELVRDGEYAAWVANGDGNPGTSRKHQAVRPLSVGGPA